MRENGNNKNKRLKNLIKRMKKIRESKRLFQINRLKSISLRRKLSFIEKKQRKETRFTIKIKSL